MSQVLKKYPLVIRDIRKYLAEEGKQEPDAGKTSKSAGSQTRRRGRSGGASDLERRGHGGTTTSSRSRIFSQYDDPIPLDHYINTMELKDD